VRLRGLFVLAALLCWGCGSAPTIQEAASLVGASPLFKKEYKANITFGERCDGLAVPPGSPKAYMDKMYPDYVFLADQGLIKITPAFEVHPNWWWQKPPAVCVREMKRIAQTSNEIASQQRTYYMWTASPTEKGTSLGIPAAGGEVVIASKELEQVTGVEEVEDDVFDATYWWRWAPSKIGESTPALIDHLTKKSKTMSGAARLQKQDGGWTVLSVSDQS
jgi:hypothetical protein